LIFLAVLVPLAVYLIILGFLNRRRTPLLVPGTWDVWGLLFASSGFWLLGGPAILSGLHENWRQWWLYGRHGGHLLDEGENWPLWVFLAILYFLGVVAVAGWQLWRARRLTSVYNIDAAALPGALGEVAERLGLHLAHTGPLYAFSPGTSAEKAPRLQAITAAQPGPAPSLAEHPPDSPHVPVSDGQTALVEVDPFPLLRHVTLRWHAEGGLVRRQVEAELIRLFRSTLTPENDVGGWLQVLGLGLLCFCSLGCVTLQILNWVLGR
jgi:hypothetical protein